MQELINQLVEKAGISGEQAEKVIHTVTDYIKEKFPMVAGAVDSLFAKGENAGEAVGDKAEGLIDSVKDKLSGLFGG